jgi:predicted secreted protein
MRLVELFLVETTEEDRAIISLASSIYDYIQQFDDVSTEPEDFDPDFDDDEFAEKDEKIITLGRIGDLFDTPLDILNTVTLELQSSYGIKERLKKEEEPGQESKGEVLGIWYNHNSTIVLNKDYLTSNKMKTSIVHELRHALDDYKSDFKANQQERRYTTPRKKEHRVKKHENDDTPYIAEPAEINARFVQVLHGLVDPIKRAVKLDPEDANKLILGTLNKLLSFHRIEELFPERTQSKSYKRLVKRAVDFIEKEIQHAKSTQPK